MDWPADTERQVTSGRGNGWTGSRVDGERQVRTGADNSQLSLQVPGPAQQCVYSTHGLLCPSCYLTAGARVLWCGVSGTNGPINFKFALGCKEAKLVHNCVDTVYVDNLDRINVSRTQENLAD